MMLGPALPDRLEQREEKTAEKHGGKERRGKRRRK